MSKRLDEAGVVMSFLCVAHCLFLSALVLLAPLYWLVWLEAEWVHGLLLILTLPIASAALVQGFRNHRQLSLLILGGSGGLMLLLALVIGHEYHSWEMPITLVGASALIIAHLGNIIISRRQSYSALRVE